ncbi:hypothetical protein J7T55_011077 [Diaporthe amygdali]|uniref:uncharacterized protein n=1 Tax=Phomopsis amygdali TaxID=1214568 RepID=UPI0022FEFA50|nr:uncharacterized protein J7T55_011077 [Diaporthe amygdali]KAJ0106982.1 hypothetical protein J7T55_011077 [Diaporthe amygdali]
MWDRFRSGTGTGGAPGNAQGPGYGHGHDPSSSSRKQQQQQRSNLSSNNSYYSNDTNSNSSNSWQPRSSVIAQRQRQQQQQQQSQPQHYPHQHQNQRSASVDNYPGGGSTGGYGGYQYSIKGGPPPPRPLRDFEVPPPVQPPARQQTFPPQQLNPRQDPRDSIAGRPTSSVYSQPSPLHTSFAPQRDRVNVSRKQPDGFEDVSPPSSPELLSPGNVRNLDISPIDEEDDPSYPQPLPKMSAVSALPSQQRVASRQGDTPSPNARSNIPMMRREKRQQRDAAAGRLRASPSQDALRDTPPREQSLRPMDSRERLRQPSPVPQSLKAMDSKERLRQPTVDYSQKPGSSNGRPRGEKNPRWDPMTGEIAMNNEKSKPSQVKPLEFARGFGLGITSPTAAERGTATSPVPPKSASGMGDRMRLMGSRMGVGSGPKQQQQQQQQPESNTDPAAAAFSSNRPGWRGASGRTAIVEPVKDNPEVAPLKIPPRSDKRSSPRPYGGPSPSPSPSPGPGLSPGGVGSGDAAMSSPPISPETQVREQSQKQQMGGGSGAGKGPLLSPSSLGGTMANTIRRIIPSSQRLPSGAGAGSGNATATGTSASVSLQGYPSPPLSSSPTHLAGLGTLGQQSAPVNANGGANHAATVKIDSDAAGIDTQHPADTSYHSPTASASPPPPPSSSSPPPPPHHQQQPRPSSPSFSSAEPSPTASQAPIRRKQVGSGGPPSAHLQPGRGAHHQPKESFASSVYSQQTEDAAPAQQYPTDQETPPRPAPIIDTRNLPGAGNDDSPYVQPPSRFSVTTYATSAHTSTPRESLEQFDRNYYNDADAPPLPTPPKDYPMTSYLDNEIPRSKQPKGASVMDRSRPKTRNGNGAWDDDHDAAPVKISLSQPWMSTAGANSAGINAQNSPPRARKEAPRGPREQAGKENRGLLAVALKNDSTNTSRPASILSVDKALPAAPPELSAESTQDRVAILNAQLQSLGNRRININKSIKQMTELMPQDNLMATPEVMRKREMEKRKVEDLQQELADVQREEHELGMKLHRAYKRLDRQADYEPTTLWVRRATGSLSSDLIISALTGLVVCVLLAFYFRQASARDS